MYVLFEMLTSELIVMMMNTHLNLLQTDTDTVKMLMYLKMMTLSSISVQIIIQQE